MLDRQRRSSRRRFLRTVAAGFAGPALISANSGAATGALAASERITSALIGSGSRGLQIVAGASQVVAVCDVDAARREDAQRRVEAMGHSGCETFGDFRELLDRKDIDAVVIATPDHWHVPIAAAAVKAGKAVYVEKPLSLTIGEGCMLRDIVRRYGGILQVGSQQRSDEKFLRACELVRNGRIGQLKNVRVEIPTRGGRDRPWSPQPVPPELDYEMWLGPAPWAPYHPDRCHYNFRFVTDYSGGDVTNWGGHQLDIAQWGLGADDSGPLEVQGHGQRNATGLHDVFYDVHVDFLYEGGVTVQLRSGGNGVRFEGSEGWVFVSRAKLEAEPKSVLTSTIGPEEIHLARGPHGAGGTHMEIWLECVRQRNARGLNVPVEVGHRSATVCHLANIAMMLQRPLRWDPVRERFAHDDEANRLRHRPMREPWRI